MKNRVVFKVIATGLNFLMSIIIGILVPRAIGPASYGEFSYIISTYAFLFEIMILSSSMAYIYFLSNGKHKIEDINVFYMIFLSFISTLVIVVGFLTINTEFGIKYLWNELDNKYLLYLGLIFGIFTTLQQRLIEFSDSTAQTVISEKLKLVSKFIIVLTIVVFIFLEKLDIYWYFILSIVNFILFFILFYNYIVFKISKVRIKVLKDIFNDFYIYLKPLIIFTLIASTYNYLGKYILQSSAGSIEQGYYNFALQLSLIPVTFLSSIMAIYMSEMTKKFQSNDLTGVKDIFINNIFKIYAVHSFLSIFTLINAKEIVLLTVGEEFIGAIVALQLLSIFSLLHTFGMLSGNLYLSTNRNKQYSIINGIFLIIGIFYLVFLYHSTLVNASKLSETILLIYFLRVSMQTLLNLIFFKVSIIFFLNRIFAITVLTLVVILVLSLFSIKVYMNFLISLIIFMIINHLFKDYMGVYTIFKKKGIEND